MSIQTDVYKIRIMDQLIQMLTDATLDTEDAIEVLGYIRNFVEEQIAHARREASPG